MSTSPRCIAGRICLLLSLAAVGCTHKSRTDLGGGYYLERVSGIVPHSGETLAIRHRGTRGDRILWPWISIRGDPTVLGGMVIFSGGRRHEEEGYEDSVGVYLSADGAELVEVSDAIRRLAPVGPKWQFSYYEADTNGIRFDFLEEPNGSWSVRIPWFDLREFYRRSMAAKPWETHSFEAFSYIVSHETPRASGPE